MNVIPLSEGSFTVDRTKHFIPFDPDNDILQERNTGSLLVEIQPFVITTSKDIILIDTGLGFSNAEGVLQIHQNLINHGIMPSEVTKVLLSHLHKDHSGGISVLQNGKRILSFENATYYINKKELDVAFEKQSSSYITEDLEILKNNPQVHLLDDDGKIDDYIRFELSGGHSPFHQVFWIEENNAVIFFGGDVVPQLHQMNNRFIAKYDFDGRKAMQLRQQWKELGEEGQWTFLFYHDIKSPVFKF